jgi:site-specific DNA-cytosine methylase
LNKNTYVSLFSCAGIGCYGFKMADWECLASCELKEKYLEIQKINQKCQQEEQYICGDISLKSTKSQVINVVKKSLGTRKLDVLMATPPCQGISLANHKKNHKDIERNSLVIDALTIIRNLSPSVFLLENVRRFLQTACLYQDEVVSIEDAIYNHLGELYDISSNVINLKDFGNQSSRTRTIVIGVLKSHKIEAQTLLPSEVHSKLLWEVIGFLPSLKVMGEISKDDIWHAFRPYKQHMRTWIKDLKPGESAFDNTDPLKRPHQIKNGVYKENVNKNGDKYQRVLETKVAPCVHTRNDILPSQNTVHPFDDRVFSIRELMLVMTIPRSFRWSRLSEQEIRRLKPTQYTKMERVIRTVIGESVPTAFVFRFAKQLEQILTVPSAKERLIRNQLQEIADGVQTIVLKEQSSPFIPFQVDNLFNVDAQVKHFMRMPSRCLCCDEDTVWETSFEDGKWKTQEASFIMKMPLLLNQHQTFFDQDAIVRRALQSDMLMVVHPSCISDSTNLLENFLSQFFASGIENQNQVEQILGEFVLPWLSDQIGSIYRERFVRFLRRHYKRQISQGSQKSISIQDFPFDWQCLSPYLCHSKQEYWIPFFRSESKSVAYTDVEMFWDLEYIFDSDYSILCIDWFGTELNNWIQKVQKLFLLYPELKVVSLQFDVPFLWQESEFEMLMKPNEYCFYQNGSQAIFTKRMVSLYSPLDFIGSCKQDEDVASRIARIRQQITSFSTLDSWEYDSIEQMKARLDDFQGDVPNWRHLSKYYELLNPNQESNEAYFTSPDIALDCVRCFQDDLQEFADNDQIARVLEPSVGTGNILEQFLLLCLRIPNLQLEVKVVDIDLLMIEFVKMRIKAMCLPDRIQVYFLEVDFLQAKWKGDFDFVIGNPPFAKATKEYLSELPFKNSSDDLFALFWQQALTIGVNISLISPRSLLATPKYKKIREDIMNQVIVQILDFGQKAFKVKIETINIAVSRKNLFFQPDSIRVVSWLADKQIVSLPQQQLIVQPFNGIVFVQDELFCTVKNKLRFNVFTSIRERTSTKKIKKTKGKYRLLGARDIGILDINDRGKQNEFVNDTSSLQTSRFLDQDNIFLAPNGTYYPRVAKLPKNCVMTGGAALMVPVKGQYFWDIQIEYLGSEEFTKFFNRCWNFAQRSLNIDSYSVQFWGELILQDKDREHHFRSHLNTLPTPEDFVYKISLSDFFALFESVTKHGHDHLLSDSTCYPLLKLLEKFHLVESSTKGFIIKNQHIFDEIFANGLLSIEQWLREVERWNSEVTVDWHCGDNISQYYQQVYINQPKLLADTPELFQCYPENYLEACDSGLDLQDTLLGQLQRIQDDCYHNKGCKFSIHRFIRLLTLQGFALPKYNSFTHVKETIGTHFTTI